MPHGSSGAAMSVPETPDPGPVAPAAAADRSLAVLLVVDGADAGGWLAGHLEQAFSVCEVTRVGTLADAMERAGIGGIDVVILDPFLPDSAGLSTFQRMIDHEPDLPVVLLVDADREDLAIEALGRGAQGYLIRSELDPVRLRRCLTASVERQRALRTVLRDAERFELALDGSSDGLWDWDLLRDAVYYSARWNSLLGLPERDVVASSQHWLGRVHPDDLPGLKDVLVEHLSGAARHFVYEHRIRDSGGDYLWVLSRGLAVRELSGRTRRMAGSMTDITARKHTEERLAFNALHDELTGLANRVLFKDRLRVALRSLSRRHGPHFGVLFLDLDRFKHVNDTYGHSVGDRLLKEIAKRLTGFLRPGDTLARLGGDEFGVLVSNVTGVSGALHVAERVQELLNLPFAVDGRRLEIGASIGIALSSTGYDEPEDILHDADIAMYRAKAAGRGQAQVFDPLMHRSAMALLRLESELRHAVERNELVMHYQPVVAFDSGKVVGFEALMRWQHPQRGLLMPDQFLAVAEETGLATPIGWWAMADVCRQLVEWQRRFPSEPPLWAAINISDRLLLQADMVAGTRSILEDTGVAPETLRVELSEDLIVRHGDQALERLEELRELGLRLTVDDFGGGVSCLGFVERFRYDALKIDPCYVRSLTGGVPTMVETILTMAAGFGIEVIAEGVETVEQASFLRRLRCPEAQGFWFAHPVEPGAAEELLVATPDWWARAGQAN